MTNLQTVNTKFTEREKVIKEIFDTVYTWGVVNIKADENSPAYRELINKLLRI